ncbi:MAG TPA: calcium/sodium antiporter [Deferrisomatales bacterium]|nr:calcium/sodium antiporter [Deferrisomatales bacterium]
MVLDLAILAAALGALVLGAELLVRGASALASRFGMSPLLIGLTLVAFGTSTPELVVSMGGALRGSGDIAIGNAVGSNVFNGFFILGLCALVRPLTVASSTVWKEIPLSLLAALAVGAAGNDVWLSGETVSTLSRGDGLLLLGYFAVFLAYLSAVFAGNGGAAATGPPSGPGLGISALLCLAGLALLILGGSWAVNSAAALARALGVSEGLIAVTILAGGTSLPELATSLVATYRGQLDLAVGNVVGSNIFNGFFILGASATVRPLAFDPRGNVDVAAAALVSLLLFAAMFSGGRKRLDRWEGALFLVLYAGYVGLRYTLEGR